MRKALLLWAMLCIAATAAIAQHASVKGVITDTSNRTNLSNAVVSLLRSKDSILYRFTRSSADGGFRLGKLPPGKFILLVSYPKYADYVDRLELKDSAALDLGKLILTLKAQLLAEVVVRQKISAIKIKGDTTEYAADSFHVQPNATVEELLKQLPGIQVDKDGKITAQGEKVQKVLVDGEEFFGDDPTLVTQNLRADMVDKVQVFDKKSDQAAFTGIDDGKKTKTINLKLKDNKKNGYFGRVSAGGGTDGYYNNEAMLNLFKKKQKFSAYGILSNTGKTGLNWQDRDKYGESFASNVDYDETSGFFMFTGSSDDLDSWNGQYNGQGYPAVKTGGLHYNNKWNDDRQSVNGNYKALQLDVNGSSATNSQYILPDTLYFINQRQLFNNRILRNRANGSYEYQFDSTSSLKVMGDGGTDHKNTANHFVSEALGADSGLVNRSSRDIATIGDTRSVNSSILWRKKLPKKGRTVSVNFSERYENGSLEGYLYADNHFYRGSQAPGQQVTDQYKQYHNETMSFDSKVTYTEPLSAISSLIANYGLTFNNSLSDRSSFNKSGSGKYTDLDSVYSNDYRFNVFAQRGGIAYNLISKKLRFNAGTNVAFTHFNQEDLHADTAAQRSFVNWYPQATLTWSFTSQRRLWFRYNGNTSQPTIQQIQPTRTNDDPLNISIGNPALKPQFGNNLNLGFNDYKVLTDRYIYGNVNYQFTENAISSSNRVDAGGKRVYQSVNLDGNRSLNAYFGYGFKWKKPSVNIGFNGNINQGRYMSIVNGLLNATNSNSYSAGINIYKQKEKKFTIGMYSSVAYTSSTSSVQTNIKTHYWTFNLHPDVDLFLPWKLQLHNDFDVNFRQKTTAFDNNTNVVLWNAWFGKKLLKSDALLIKASVNDLLNRNIGFNRTVNSNFISQNTYATIQRYFMLSVVWNFNKAGTPQPQQR